MCKILQNTDILYARWVFKMLPLQSHKWLGKPAHPQYSWGYSIVLYVNIEITAFHSCWFYCLPAPTAASIPQPAHEHVYRHEYVKCPEMTSVMIWCHINKNWMSRACTQRTFPFCGVWCCCRGGLWGTAARSGHVNPNLCLEGRPAWLQLWLLRPWESSQTSQSQSSSRLERHCTKLVFCASVEKNWKL